MGHLINPIAFRVGHSRSWETNWFVKNNYYPEYLHSILNIRNYIFYIFRLKKIIKCGIFLSNLVLFKFNKQYIIKLFIYHIDLERISYNFINTVYGIYYKLIKEKRKLLFDKFFTLHNSDLFIFIFIFFNIFFKNIRNKLKKINIKNLEKINNYTNLLNEKLNDNLLNNLLKNNKYKEKETKNQKIYNRNQKLFNKSEFDVRFNNENLKFYFENLDIDVNYIIKKNNLSNYFLNNFLYIAKKLDFRKYNSSWDFDFKWNRIITIFKIFKDLKYLDKQFNFYNYFFLYLYSIYETSKQVKMSDEPFHMRNLVYTYIYILLGKKYFFVYFSYISEYWAILFKFISNINNIKFYYFFVSNKDITANFIARYIGFKLRQNYYLFPILNPIKKDLWRINLRNRQVKFNYRTNWNNKLYNFKYKFQQLLGSIITKFNVKILNFFKYYYSFIIYNFFEIKYYIKNKYRLEKNLNYYILNKYLFISIFYSIFFNFNKSKFNFFTFKLNNNNFIKLLLFNLLNTFNSNIYNNIKLFNILNTPLLLVSANFMKFYIYYNYLKSLWLTYNVLNKHDLRKKLVGKYKNAIVGYKMAFHGRFSRKQKSSSIWYTHGRVPLNKVNINIDYSFNTVPLKNSAVSIKIWLYKNLLYKNYKYILKC
jgi:hypothetical protein